MAKRSGLGSAPRSPLKEMNSMSNLQKSQGVGNVHLMPKKGESFLRSNFVVGPKPLQKSNADDAKEVSGLREDEDDPYRGGGGGDNGSSFHSAVSGFHLNLPKGKKIPKKHFGIRPPPLKNSNDNDNARESGQLPGGQLQGGQLQSNLLDTPCVVLVDEKQAEQDSNHVRAVYNDIQSFQKAMLKELAGNPFFTNKEFMDAKHKVFEKLVLQSKKEYHSEIYKILENEESKQLKDTLNYMCKLMAKQTRQIYTDKRNEKINELEQLYDDNNDFTANKIENLERTLKAFKTINKCDKILEKIEKKRKEIEIENGVNHN